MSGRRDVERKMIAQATALAEVARFPEMNPGPVLRVEGDEGTVILANAAARKVFGDELVGQRWHDICPGINPAIWQRVLDAVEPLYVDARIGERDYVFAHRRDHTSSLVFIFGSDITRQKDAERMLAEVARFPEMNPGPVLRCELDSKVILANAAARQVFGNELVGLRWRDCVAGIDNAMWNRIMQGTEPIYLEARIGEREYVFAHRRDHDGSLVFVFGADVTQQKQAERALRQSERMATLGTLAAGVAHELNNPAAATHRSSEQLREAFIRLQENQERLAATTISAHGREYVRALVEQARLAAGGSTDLDALGRSDREADVEEWLDQHGIANAWELSPPLVAQGLAPDALTRLEQAVSADALDVAVGTVAHTFPVYRLLREIGEGSARISELVGALKSYSYLGQAPLQEVALHEGLDNTLVILRHKLKRGIQVEREYSTVMPRVPAYGSELNQVWTNLLDNAADAMDGSGRIVIRTRMEPGWAVVEVEDDGPGIPATVQARIFDPFFTTKAPGKGTGLGLSTSYSIITEKHHGQIEVESRPGFTRFTVRLPLPTSPQHPVQGNG
jgi:signal transduction histidine kinase